MANKSRAKRLAVIGMPADNTIKVEEVHKGAFVAKDAYVVPRPYFLVKNGGLHLAQMIIAANQNAKDDSDLRATFALIHQYALAVLRDADAGK